MLDIITKRVGRIKDTVRKGVVPKKMKVVLVLNPETVYIVQTRYFDQHSIKRPGRRIMVETEQAAAERLVSLAIGVTPKTADVVVVDGGGLGKNQISYVFWFAPDNFDITELKELHGFVLSLKEQLSLVQEFLLIAEAKIVAKLLVKAAAQRPDFKADAA